MEEMQNKLIEILKEHNVSDEHIKSLEEFMSSGDFKMEEMPGKIEEMLKAAGDQSENLGDKVKEIVAKVTGGNILGM